jgi:hypothetical protein
MTQNNGSQTKQTLKKELRINISTQQQKMERALGMNAYKSNPKSTLSV